MNFWFIATIFILLIYELSCQICFDRCRESCKHCTMNLTFECDDGTCIDIQQFRNSVKDCPDESDEMCCHDEYQCDTRGMSKNCVNSSLVDNEIPNCGDKSDETNEVVNICNALSAEGEVYKCKMHPMGPKEALCIMKNKLLNGVEDCPLGDDENPAHLNECELGIAKCHAAATCTNIEEGTYHCACPANFAGDGVENCQKIEQIEQIELA